MAPLNPGQISSPGRRIRDFESCIFVEPYRDKENRGASRVGAAEEKGAGNAEGKKDGAGRVPASGSQAGLAARELLQILNILDHQSLPCGNIRKYWPYICFSTEAGSMARARPSALPAGNRRL